MQERLSMRKIKDVLRLQAAGLSNRQIAKGLRIARSTMRLAVASGPLLAGTLALLALAARAESGVVPGVVGPLVGCILIACGASAVARRSVAEPGDAVAGAIIAAFTALSLVNPLARWVDLFPTHEGQRWGGSLVLWAVVAVVCVVLVALATRDPLD